MIKKVFFILAVIVALGVGYWGISPIFTSVELNESLPEGMELTKMEGVDVIGTTGHPASGTVHVVEVGGKTYIRYEDFKTLNGPDLFVYLAKDLNAHEFVNLGKLRATEGNVNYEIPNEVDVSEYRYILVWCRAFSVLFNYADILNFVDN